MVDVALVGDEGEGNCRCPEKTTSMEQSVIAQVLKSQQLDSCRNKLQSRKPSTTKSKIFKADQNWLALCEKLDQSREEKEGKNGQKKRRRVKPNELQKGISDEETTRTTERRENQKDTCPPLQPVLKTEQDTKNDKIMEPLHKSPRITNVVSLDCEFVGVGKEGKEHSLARVSIVNFKGEVLYDKYVVNNKEPVVDYRTWVSGIRPEHLKSPDAVSFEQAQKDVHAIISNRILVGHAIHHDMHALLLSHPRKLIRDTAVWRGLRRPPTRKTPSLKKLAQEILGMKIQAGEHDSVEDARATLMIYKRFAKQWEKELQMKKNGKLKERKPRKP